jgi:hypothetical protein
MKKRQLLSIGTNAKTVKGDKLGFLTGVMYLAPADLSGYQMCAMALTAQCKDPCLNSAGRGAFTKTQVFRIQKTREFVEQRQEFMETLVWSIHALIRQAARKGLIPLVRLNGTSDIKWEHIYFNHMGKLVTIFEVFPDLQFYDYTKMSGRQVLPANYDLTFSYSGVAAYQKYVKLARYNGMRIAVVFRSADQIPSDFMGMECIGGDDSDVRHIEPKNVVVALYAKGKAVKDTSGFVVDAARKIIPIYAV